MCPNDKQSEFDVFLKGLSDHELTIFIGYRLDDFLSGSKEKIIREVKDRKLTKDIMENYFKKKLNEDLPDSIRKCPRCGSEKLFVETDYENRLKGKYSSAEIAIDTFRCRLCDYNPDKELPKNIIEKIKRLFINKKRERIVKWDTW